MKKTLCMLLAMAMLLGLMPMAAFAEAAEPAEVMEAAEIAEATEAVEATEIAEATEAAEVTEPTEIVATTEATEPAEAEGLSAYYVNPIYADLAIAQDWTAESQNQELYSGSTYASDTVYYTDPSEVAPIVREELEKRSPSIQFYYQIPAEYYSSEGLSALATEILIYAVAHTGVPTQGDYLGINIAGLRIQTVSGSWNEDQTRYATRIILTPSYLSTAYEESQVTEAVNALLAELNPTGTNYARLKAVYDWMCENISYDHENQYNFNRGYTAYGPMVYKEGLSFGFATLLYRLALELGIDCRIIIGEYSGEYRAWNIALMDGQYYNLDAGLDSDLTEHSYFLKCDANFTNHTRDAAYADPLFYEYYPMGSSDFNPSAVTATGTCDENLTWVLAADGTLTISGSGDMSDFNPDTETYAPWDEYWYMINSVVIEPGVSGIGDAAFFSLEYLRNATLADTVTRIGLGAFAWCLSLAEITIPKSVTAIGDSAFVECISLTGIRVDSENPSYSSDAWGVLYNRDKTELIQAPGALEGEYTIADTTTRIGDLAFADCWKMTHVTVPESVTEIGDYAFTYCIAMTKIVFCGDAPAFAENCFAETTTTVFYPKEKTGWTEEVMHNHGGTLEWVVYESNLVASGECGEDLWWTLNDNGVLTISGTGSLSNCTWGDYISGITQVIIQPGVTKIGDDSFYGHENLTDVTIPDTVTQIGDEAFRACNSLQYITIPGSVTYIGYHTFFLCENLTSVTFQEGVTTIGNAMFERCGKLTNISLPSTLTTIDSNAFEGCVSLTSIPFPASLETIGEEAFYRCTGLTSICLPENVAVGNRAFQDCSNVTSVTIPASVVNLGSSPFGGCNLTTAGPMGGGYDLEFGWVEILPANAFYGCKGLTDVVIPDSVTTIGGGAFSGCSGLTEISLPDGVTTIGGGAFSGCSGLTEISLPDGVTTIGASAFSSCGITSITIPEGVTSIARSLFQFCPNLVQVSIPGSVTSIGDYAFFGCSALTEFAVPVGVETIGNRAFYQCAALSSVTIPGSVTTIDEYAFSECGALTNLTIAEGVTTLNRFAFSFCESLTSVTLPGSLTSVGVWVFNSCSNLTEVTFGEGAKTVSNHMFSQCSNLTTVNLPDSITTIGSYAFNECTGLTSITFPANLTTIDAYAFCECSSLKEVTFTGDAPEINYTAFQLVTATAYYPMGNDTWTEEVRENCGGRITWVAVCPEHIWGEWGMTTAPTCTEAGEETRACTICAKPETRPVDALGHMIELQNVKDVTCTDNGYTGDEVCTRCGETITKGESIAAPGHECTSVVTDPTCTEQGFTTHTCTRCGEVSVDTYVDALGHSVEQWHVSKEPSVGAEGTVSGTCTVCGGTATETIPMLNKTDYSYEVIKEPTNDEPGLVRYVLVSQYGTFTFEVAVNTLLPGDVNGDGNVNIMDLMRLANFFAGKAEINRNNADVNGDGNVNIMDLMRLANYFAGKATLG